MPVRLFFRPQPPLGYVSAPPEGGPAGEARHV